MQSQTPNSTTDACAGCAFLITSHRLTDMQYKMAGIHRFISQTSKRLTVKIWCADVCTGVGVCMWVQVPKEGRGVGSLGAGVTSHWEPFDVGAGNRSQVLCNSSMHF